MTRRSPTLVLAGVGLLAAFTAARAADVRPRLFVLEAEPARLTAVALDNGNVLAHVDLQGQPWMMIPSPDGAHVVVLDRGPGKETLRFGYHPTGKAAATVVGAAALEAVGRAELCWNVGMGASWGEGSPQRGIFSPDGRRLTLPCTGYRSQKPEETLAAEIVNLDLETGAVSGRVEVPRGVDSLRALPGTALGVVYSARETPKNKPALPAELRFVDLASLQVESTLSLDGDPGPPTLSPDGAYLYLLELGKPDKKPEKNVNGRVQVVSVARRAHEVNLDAGRAPRGIVLDHASLQAFVLSEGPPPAGKEGDRPGELRVIRGADLAATIPVGEEPLFLRVSPDRERLYVVSEKTLTAVDLPALSRLATSELKPAGISLLTSGGGKSTVKELAISADGRRGYALYQTSSKLGVLDLEERKLVAEVSTGRGGVKFGKFLGALAATVGSYYVGYSAASAAGGGYFTYYVYGVAPANTQVALSADEKFVYVLNTQSNDVTVVNTETHEIVDKIGVGGSANRLELLPGGAFVAVTTGADTLHLIDTTKNVQVSELPDGGNYIHSPDRRYAAAIAKDVVYCMDGATLKTLGRATGLKKPIQVQFEPLPGAAEPEPPAAEPEPPAAEPEPPPAEPEPPPSESEPRPPKPEPPGPEP